MNPFRALQAIIGRRQSYRRIFLNPTEDLKPDAEAVLVDLARFCRGNRACIMYGQNGHVDPFASAILQGRREVWLRITEHLHLPDSKLVNMVPTPINDEPE